MNRPHALSVVVIESPMVNLPVLMHRAVLIALEIFLFRWIVYLVNVFQVVAMRDLFLDTNYF